MFKVGDLVTGKDKDHYGFTTSDAIMLVTDINGSQLTVKILTHKNKHSCLNKTYFVNSEHFILARPKFKGNK